MRKLLSVTLGVGLLAAMAAFQAPKQDARNQETRKPEVRIQTIDAANQDQTDNPMFFVVVEHVKPSMVQQYEDATKSLIKALKHHDIDPTEVGFKTVSGPELGYAFIMPLEEGFASMPTLKATWMKAIDTVGEENWAAISDRADEAVERREVIHCIRRDDISHTPRTPRLTKDEVAYIGYTFYYPIPGKEKNVDELAAQFASLYERNNINDSWTVYQCVTGSDLPKYVIAFPARSQADLATRREEIKTALGVEGEELSKRSAEFARKIELKEGAIRRDLSYVEK